MWRWRLGRLVRAGLKKVVARGMEPEGAGARGL